ncbi:MAG: alpha/beta fold hydrolase [Myxococcota bacterium]|jgi:phospholipase/carboxylesterase|nr:alpha/beta fold hydrolase [Myxococcota bacterium]
MRSIQKIVRYRVGDGGPQIVLLHGFAGGTDDLSAFAKSMGVNGEFFFPEAPLALDRTGAGELGGHTWWPSDGASRALALASGQPRDLSSFEPPELEEARATLREFLDTIRVGSERTPLVLGGFSQGAMLAFDYALHSARELAALVMLSGCRIAERKWNPLLEKRRGQRAFISHGRADPDLAFSATERFKDDLTNAGWLVDFLAFEGGHGTSVQAVRGLKKFLRALA